MKFKLTMLTTTTNNLKLKNIREEFRHLFISRTPRNYPNRFLRFVCDTILIQIEDEEPMFPLWEYTNL